MKRKAGRNDASTVKTAQKSILVIDDNALAADSIARLLTALGWEAHSVYSAATACAFLTDTTVDLVLLDIGMPDVDGYELATLLRNEMRLSIPIVALTGYSFEDDTRLTSSGFTSYIPKPVGMVELRDALTVLLT